MRLVNWLIQIVAVTRVSLLTVRERKGSVIAAAFGIAGVVAVMVGVLSIARGFLRVMDISGSPDTALVMRSGADSEMMSVILRDEANIVADAPGVARTPAGPLASAELFVIIDLPKRTTGTDANVPLRGVEPAALEVRGNIDIVSGRMFDWGKNEVIVGRGAAAEFAGLDLGGSLEVGGGLWPIVGIFTSGGSIAESEIWCDAGVLQPAYRRGSSYQAVYTRLTSPEAFQEFKDSLTSDPRLDVKVIRQTDYYIEQSRMVFNLVTGLGTIIAGLMGIGAVFGALNTMYSAVAARTREIATLRALGFRSGPVVISILLESVLLALAGGFAGGGLAWLAFDGYRAATINWQSFSQVAFAFDVTLGLLVQGVFYAVLIGLVGGFFPAVRAARLPVARALREL